MRHYALCDIIIGCETWTLLATDVSLIRLEAFHMKYQRHDSQDPLAGPGAEHRRFLSDRSWSCAGSNRPSSQLTVWTSSQTSRWCPPSLAVPHRSVTRSPSRPELEAMSKPLSEQVAWPTPQGNSTPPADLWRRAVTRGHSGVLDDYALTTTVGLIRIVISIIWSEHYHRTHVSWLQWMCIGSSIYYKQRLIIIITHKATKLYNDITLNLKYLILKSVNICEKWTRSSMVFSGFTHSIHALKRRDKTTE